MRRNITVQLILSLSLLVAACQTGSPVRKLDTERVTPVKKAATGVSSQPLASAGIPAASVSATGALVPNSGVASRGMRVLSGSVKLLSDQGGSLISNNGAALIFGPDGAVISPETGRVLSNNSGNLISNNGGNLIGKTKFYGLRSQSSLAEDRLAEATVEVVDAEGRALLDADGDPVQALSDRDGNYVLNALLPDENLILRVRLNERLAGAGAELRAMLVAKTLGASATLDIDTSASLAAHYVLGEYVKGQQNVFNRLPQDANRDLRNEVEKARGLLPAQVPGYQPAAMVKLLAGLRQQARPLNETLEQVKVLLLGQERLGEGLPALDVPLAEPGALVDDGAGGFLVAEERVGRLRRVSADGRVSTYMDRLQGQMKRNVVALFDVFRARDGQLYMSGTQAQGHGIHRLGLDGTLTQLVGGRAHGRAVVGQPALASETSTRALWVDEDGTLWFGEDTRAEGGVRVLSVGPDGVVREPASPLPSWQKGNVVGLVRGSDRAMYALVAVGGGASHVARWAPGESAWSEFAKVEGVGARGDLVNALDGGLWVSEDLAGKLFHLALDGTRRVLLDKAAGSPIQRPGDMLPRADGSLLVLDAVAGVVYRVDATGGTEPVAGLDPRRALDLEKGIALNAPQGLALDAAGRVLIAERGANAIQVWNGSALSLLAGGAQGAPKVKQSLTSATFNGPVGVVARAGLVYVVDRGNATLRVIDEMAGEVRVVARPALALPLPVAPGVDLASTELSFADAFSFTAGANGPLYFTASYRNQVVRVDEKGQGRLLAGTGEKGDSGDGGPAVQARLDLPGGAVVTPAGDLLVADVSNMRIRRVVDPAGSAPRIEAFAGLPRAQAVARLEASYAGGDEGRPATEAAFAAPAAMCFDGAGNLYVAEMGTAYTFLLPTLPAGEPLLDVESLPLLPPRIRRIDVQGRIATLVGPGGTFLKDPTAPDALVLPSSLLVDSQGRLVVADAGANVVRFFPLRIAP